MGPPWRNWQNRLPSLHREWLALTTDRGRIYQFFKYAVYAFLTANIFIFFAEEWAAVPHRFPGGLVFGDYTEAFAATIDTAAWVVLLLMFELETSILDDKHFTRRVTWTLHGLRAICYLFIIDAFSGYVTKLSFLTASVPLAGVTDLCALVDGTWAYAVDLDEYAILTPANCGILSNAASFLQFPGVAAAVDQADFVDIIRLAWTDVINAGVWLIVVAVLEIDVFLQERGKLEGPFLKVSNAFKYLLYATLLGCAIYWTVKGDLVDSWDAYLWLAAFVFIELNVFDWRQESLEELLPTEAPAG